MSKIIATIVVEPGDRVSVRQTGRIVGFGYVINNQTVDTGKVDIKIDSDKKYYVTVNDYQWPPSQLKKGNNYFE